jgi:hypothetical protein
MFRKLCFIMAAAFFMILLVSGAYAENTPAKTAGAKTIILEIDYGKIKPSRSVELCLDGERTVLEVLETAAVVETHPVAGYVFVTAVDGVKGERGKTAWYYQVDGKPSSKLAYTRPAEGAKHIKWSYQEDVCSGKVDNKLKEGKGKEAGEV